MIILNFIKEVKNNTSFIFDYMLKLLGKEEGIFYVRCYN